MSSLASYQDASGNVNIVTPTTPMPVTPAGGTTPGAPSATTATTVQGIGYTGTFTVARAANTTAYTAGDVVGGALTLASIGPASGEIIITAVRIMLNITALPTGMSTFALHIYDATPPSAITDNSPFTLASGDRANYLGKITGITAAAEGIGTQSVVARLENVVEQFKIASGSQLFAYLVTDAGFTPAANSETYSGKIKSLGV